MMKIKLTEDEFSKCTQPCSMAACVPGVKPAATNATLQNVAMRLWPTGSSDHYHMKQLAPFAMGALYSGHDVALEEGFRRWLCCLTQHGREASARWVGPADSKKPKGDAGSKTEHFYIGDDDEPKNMGNNDKDAGARGLAEQASHYPSLHSFIDDCGIVWGVDKDDSEDKQMKGRVIGPYQESPVIYANTPANVKDGIERRMTAKKLKFSCTESDKARIGCMVSALITGLKRKKGPRFEAVFSHRRIDEWCASHADLLDCKSSKWTPDRFENGMANLLRQIDPTMQFKVAVKAENMTAGKAPRILIADGDEGQIMALMTIKCIEDILFEVYKDKSIKHRSKRKAMDDVAKMLRRPNKRKTAIVEGDGTAWDARCGSEIRGITENPIIDWVTSRLTETCIIPESWLEAHAQACHDKTLKLFMRTKKVVIRPVVDAIRRSGHRGTSVLNWLVNFILWHASVFTDGSCFIDPVCRHGLDTEGKQRWFAGAFEGDDSIIGTDELPETLIESIKAFWLRCGFEMKLIFGKQTAEFTGWILGVDDKGITADYMPDVLRGLKNSPFSTSRTAIESDKGRAQVGRDAFLARAHSYVGRNGLMCNHYLKLSKMWAAETGAGGKVDHETQMQVRGFVNEEGITYADLMSAVEAETDKDDLEGLRALGWSITDEEAAAFRMWPATLDNASYREALPLAWRVPRD